jgi:serpin B
MKRGFVVLSVLSSLLVLGIILAGCTSTAGTSGTNATPSTEPTPTPQPSLSANGSSADASESVVVAANNRFAEDLYQQFAHDPQYTGSNIFFSPFSLSSALAITYEGARGTTADEIRSVFNFPSDNTTLREGFSHVNAGINSRNALYNLSTANALWAENNYPFLRDYIRTAGQWYSANVTNLDFIGQPEASRQTINTWVANRTNDKIQNLLPSGSIDAATRLVITNAVYFKGAWVKQFDANDTQDADFNISPQKTVSVKMMQRTDESAVYPYAETSDLQVLSMPYASGNGSGLSMIVLLPKNDSLVAAENALDPQNLSALEQSFSSRRVMVYFPKFKLDAQYQLSGTLAAMGMPTAFTGSADFSGMDGNRDLYISDVVHKAYIDVNEEGTEAAAATGVVFWASAIGPGNEEPIPVFRADHPFLFLIQDNDSGAIIFAGRIDNPNGT